MRFGILGHLQVTDDLGSEVGLGGPKQRTVLAHLLLRANHVVPTDLLIEEIWGERLPQNPRNTLQTYVSNLRKGLGQDRIEGRAGGYVLRVERDELDASRFEALVTEARAISNDPLTLSSILEEALSMWRGPALADLWDEPSLTGEIARLEERRLTVTERWLAAQIDAGRHMTVVGQLDVLTQRHPMRERLWANLMLALYRAGRQADSLAAYQKARQVLADQLGIDPSPELQQLHQRILNQDAALSGATPQPQVAAPIRLAGGELAAGSGFGGYRIDGVLGRGGTSVVYLAEQLGLGRRVALKVFTPAFAESQGSRDRFERESQLAASIDHPNVIPIYEAGDVDGRLFIAMRYVEGSDLGAILRADGPLDPERVRRIVRQVAGALDAAHARGLVHRDVKPGNVLIAHPDRSEGEHVYLSDFGLTRSTVEAAITGSGRFVGTVNYAAPEQFEGGTQTPATDVYSLGCVLYECLAGIPPFARENDAAVMYGHLLEEPPPLAGQRPDLPSPIDEVLRRSLAKRPEHRFQSARELVGALDVVFASASAPHVPVGSARPAGLGATAAYTDVSDAAPSLPDRGDALDVARATARAIADRSGRGSVAVTAPASTGDRSAPPKTRRRWAVFAAVAAVLALVAVSISLLSRDGGVHVGANAIARMNVEDGRVEVATALGQRPGASAIGFGSVWVAQPDRGVVARLGLDEGSVQDTIRVGNAPSGVAVGGGSVWVTNAGDGTIDRINVQTNEVSQRLRAGSAPTGIAFGDGVLWVADPVGAALLRVDPASEDVRTVPLAGLPSGVTFTPSGVWVSIAPNSVARVDPSSLTVLFTQTVGNGPTAVVSAFGSIWVSNQLDGTVTRLDPSTGREEAKIPVGEGPNALVAAGASMWVANELDDTVFSIDPSRNIVEQTVVIGGATASLASEGDGVWLAVGASATEHRGGTLRISSEEGAPTSLDPAIAYDSEAWRILTITNDGLLAYRKIGGPGGASLVPDLASALPDVTAGGLTYRFPLRPGIRYSTGELIRPEDFRHGIERALAMHEAAYLLSAIDGADRCSPDDPEGCDLSDSIVVDREAVTIHLARPDPDLPFKLAMPFAYPVPSDTPFEDQGWHPLPATGPYMIGEAGPDGIELVRNPGFVQWSGAAQPDGFVDGVSWRFGQAPRETFAALSSGQIDLMLDTPAPGDLAAFRSEHPDRIVAWPGPFTLFVGFDVRKPPFDDERVRRAINYALDRGHIIELLGGPTVHRPTCQILPPNFMGYIPYCPYTLEPQSGLWSAPDPDRARALIRAAGAVGERTSVAVTDTGGLPGGAVAVMEYVTDVLDDLGLDPELEIVHDAERYFRSIYPPAGSAAGTWAGTRRHPNVYLSGWLPDYLGAGNFIDPQFACGERGFANASGWCDEALDARMDQARLLATTDAGAANRAWAELEHRLVDAAVVAPVTNPLTIHAVSSRVENVQVHPQWGIMLSRLWVQ